MVPPIHGVVAAAATECYDAAPDWRTMENVPAKNPLARLIARLDQLPRSFVIWLTFLILTLVVVVDILTGYEISCTVFYLLAIGLATWFVGAQFGIFVSLLSTVFTSCANVVTGQTYHNPFAPFWNAAIVLSFYLIVVALLRGLRTIQDTLERRVRERTAKLSEELAERKRLEREILVISEREQRRIGLDIHDSLCQHLTGTALAEAFLLEKLTARQAPEIADAFTVVRLIEEAIAMARGLAVGLSPIETEGEGLLTALNGLAEHFSDQFKVSCHFSYDEPVMVHDTAVATHLYRIVQEAMHNAIRHGKARSVAVHLAKTGSRVSLTITDNGRGLPADLPVNHGMGLRNMQYRASMFGGSITLEPGNPGAVLACTFPDGAAVHLNP
jgi:signal transduction histidine kinase